MSKNLGLNPRSNQLCCCCSAAKSCPTFVTPCTQHARLPCPLLSPRVSSDSCPLSHWCHPTISSSVTPFSSCSQSFPASRYFLQVELTSIFLSIWTLVPFHRQWILVADLGLWSFPSSPSPTTWFLDMRQSMAVKETRLHINRDKYIRINKDNYIYIMLIITYRQTEPFG